MDRCFAFYAAGCGTFDAVAHIELRNNEHHAWSTAAPSRSDSDLRMPRLCRHTPEPVPCTAAYMGHTASSRHRAQLAPCRVQLTCRKSLQGYPSVGDVHSTVTVPRDQWFEYGGERSGRFQVPLPASPGRTLRVWVPRAIPPASENPALYAGAQLHGTSVHMCGSDATAVDLVHSVVTSGIFSCRRSS